MSYANVASSLALFLALGGGAYAASGGFVASSGAVRFCVNRAGAASVVRAGRRCRRGTTTIVLNEKGRTGASGTNGARGPVGPSTGAAGGDLTGTYPNPFIANGKVNTARLAEAAVSNSKLADSSVNSAKIQDGQVRAADLGPIIEVRGSSSLPAGKAEAVNAEIQCPPKTTVISGGFKSSIQGVYPFASERFENGWTAQFENQTTFPATVTAMAYCLQE